MKVETAGYHFVHNGNPFIIDRTGLSNHLILLFHSPVCISINNQTPVTSKGCCAVILKKDTPRRYLNVNGEPLENDYIQFSYGGEIDFSKYGLEADRLYRDIPQNYMNSLSRLVSNIVQEQRENLYNSNIIADLYLDVFLNMLGQCVNATPNYNLDHPLSQTLYKVRNHLLRNFQNNPDIKKEAQNIGLSQYYFRRLYKEIFGSTPQQDIIDTRINYACWLLRNTDDTIATISNECGYRNVEHFMRQFKQNIQMTPSEYRNKVHPQE